MNSIYQYIMDQTPEQILEQIIMTELSGEVLAGLFPYQVQHVQNILWCLRKNGVAVDCSDTGTGKTISSVAIAKQEGFNIFVIGPKSVIPNWYQIAREWGVPCLGVVNYETLKNGKYYSDESAECREECPYIRVTKQQKKNSSGGLMFTDKGHPKMEIIKVQWEFPPGTLVIFDEAHKGKNGVAARKKSENSKVISSIKPYLRIEQHVYGLFLSATITDRVECLDAVLYVIGRYRPYTSISFRQYLTSLGYSRKDPKSDERVMAKINKILFPRYGSRMRIADTGDKFKQNDVKAETYPVDTETARQIEAEHHKIQEAMDAMREKGMSHGIGYIIRCWQRIEILKSPTLTTIAKSFIDQGFSVVLFINYTETRSLLTDRLVELGLDLNQIGYIHGEQSLDEREEMRLKFQSDEIICLICQINAGGVGISLHDIHGMRPRASLICPTWDAIAMQQAMGRIYRAGAKSDSAQRIVYCVPVESRNDEFNIEKFLCDNVNKKLSNIGMLNNGVMAPSIC